MPTTGQRTLLEYLMFDTPFDDFLCANCSHKARRHFTHVGPCADCWEKLIDPICPHFIMREEDRNAVEAIKI